MTRSTTILLTSDGSPNGLVPCQNNFFGNVIKNDDRRRPFSLLFPSTKFDGETSRLLHMFAVLDLRVVRRAAFQRAFRAKPTRHDFRYQNGLKYWIRKNILSKQSHKIYSYISISREYNIRIFASCLQLGLTMNTLIYWLIQLDQGKTWTHRWTSIR